MGEEDEEEEDDGDDDGEVGVRVVVGDDKERNG